MLVRWEHRIEDLLDPPSMRREGEATIEPHARELEDREVVRAGNVAEQLVQRVTAELV
jgi:hypothetical protein